MKLKKLRGYIIYGFSEVTFYVAMPFYILSHPWSITYLHLLKKNSDTTTKNRIPWFSLGAIRWLQRQHLQNMRVLEYGAGGSTLFFLDKGCDVVSIENNPVWLVKVQEKAGAEKASFNPDLSGYTDEYFDMVVIDEGDRNAHIQAALPLLKKGGLLILDDSERKSYTAREGLSSWKQHVFTGPAPTCHYFQQTSIYTKPA